MPRHMWKLTLGPSLFLLLAHLIGLSFASPVANAAAVLIGAAISVAALIRWIARGIARRWLRWLLQAGLGLAALVGAAVALLGLLLGGTLGRPDYEGYPGDAICRGWSYGDATVSVQDERTEIALYRSLGPLLEWRVARRSWQGESGEAFDEFWTECDKLAGRHGG